MLTATRALDRDGVVIADVRCRHRCGRGEDIEHTTGHTLVFVRRGCFLRHAHGIEAMIDPTVAYFLNPGIEQRYDHPLDTGDDCTAVTLDTHLIASLWGGTPTLPVGALWTSAAIDLEHRLLLSAARRHADPHGLVERAILLTARTLERSDQRRVNSGRPKTARAHRALADAVREALVAEPDRALPELARALAVSPHHLSRVFRSITGQTITGQRLRLRVRSALERLAGGEFNLARLAAELKYADQSHLCRAIRAETGNTPAALRRALQTYARTGADADTPQIEFEPGPDLTRAAVPK